MERTRGLFILIEGSPTKNAPWGITILNNPTVYVFTLPENRPRLCTLCHNGWPPPPPPVIVEQEEFFKVVEEMPMFPGCDGSDTYEERKSCAQQKLMYYVYNSVEYPAEAKEKGKEGVAVVRFKVSAEGKVYGEEILRDPGAGMGEAALKTVRQMITDDIRWEPGRLSGKKVAVQFHLPVRFKLE